LLLVRINTPKLHLMPRRNSACMLQCRDVARDFSQVPVAKLTINPVRDFIAFYRTFRKSHRKSADHPHRYRGGSTVAGADDQDIPLSNVGRTLIPPRTARVQMLNSPSKSSVSTLLVLMIKLKIQSKIQYHRNCI